MTVRSYWCAFSRAQIMQYSTVQYSTVQYSTVQYSTVQYSTVQYSMHVISAAGSGLFASE